jgi:hypothetical protein
MPSESWNLVPNLFIFQPASLHLAILLHTTYLLKLCLTIQDITLLLNQALKRCLQDKFKLFHMIVTVTMMNSVMMMMMNCGTISLSQAGMFCMLIHITCFLHHNVFLMTLRTFCISVLGSTFGAGRYVVPAEFKPVFGQWYEVIGSVVAKTLTARSASGLSSLIFCCYSSLQRQMQSLLFHLNFGTYSQIILSLWNSNSPGFWILNSSLSAMILLSVFSMRATCIPAAMLLG